MAEVTQRHRELAAAIDAELIEIERQGYSQDDHTVSNQEAIARHLAAFESSLARESAPRHVGNTTLIITSEGAMQARVYGVPLGEWGVTRREGEAVFSVTHLPTGMCAAKLDGLEAALRLQRKLAREVASFDLRNYYDVFPQVQAVTAEWKKLEASHG